MLQRSQSEFSGSVFALCQNCRENHQSTTYILDKQALVSYVPGLRSVSSMLAWQMMIAQSHKLVWSTCKDDDTLLHGYEVLYKLRHIKTSTND